MELKDITAGFLKPIKRGYKNRKTDKNEQRHDRIILYLTQHMPSMTNVSNMDAPIPMKPRGKYRI